MHQKSASETDPKNRGCREAPATHYLRRMILIEDTLVSEDLLERKFVCDLAACKGACCVQGESGAPLEEDELQLLEEAVPHVLPLLSPEAQERIRETGLYERDSDGDWVTPLMPNQGACVYTVFDSDGTAKCGIEQAHRNGKFSWMKPLSCHLYPVRLKTLKDFIAVNVHRWPICEPACACGEQLDVPVFRFLKAALVRKFGTAWYTMLEEADRLRSESAESS